MTGRRRVLVPTRWLGIAAIWAGIGLFDAMQTVLTMRSQGMHHAWTALFITRLLAWLPWALATPLVIRLARTCSPLQDRSLSKWLVHLGAVVGINLIVAAWATLLQVWLDPWAQAAPKSPFTNDLLTEFSYELLPASVLYAAILTITVVVDSREALAQEQTRAARQDEQLSKAQLHALQRQVEPHFMFNALNAISGLVRERRNQEAVAMMAGLSDFLRRTIDGSNRPEVPLANEIEFLERYVAIQKMRFAERLQVTMDIAPELQAALVPRLILQPLVENAIKHGIAKRARGGTVHIAGSHANGLLNLSICNDGPSLPPDWELGTAGIGLANLRSRMQLLYGVGFALSLRNEDAKGVRVVVSLPFKVA